MPTSNEKPSHFKDVGDAMIPWKTRIASIASAMEFVADEAEICGADWLYQVTGCVISDEFMAACPGFPDYITDDRYPAAACLRAIMRHLLNLQAHGSEDWKWVDGIWVKRSSLASATEPLPVTSKIEIIDRPTSELLEQLRGLIEKFSDHQLAQVGVKVERDDIDVLWLRDIFTAALERCGRDKPAAQMRDTQFETGVSLSLNMALMVELVKGLREWAK